MRAGITKGEQNLILLEAMIPRNERLYVWCYGADGEKKGNSCPGPLEETLDHAVRHLGGWEKARQYAARPDSKKPPGSRPEGFSKSVGDVSSRSLKPARREPCRRWP